MGLFPQESVGRARKVRCRLVDSFVWLAMCIDTADCVTDRVVSMLDSGTEGPRFKLQSCRCWVTVLGKLFTPIVSLFTKQQNL